MVPPRSPPPSTMSTCSAIVAMTGSGVCGSNSVEPAWLRPSSVRAYSMTIDCRPRHRPSVGILLVRA